jgi:bifunctional UDP-N-acetylglucosamine pyrophosphorylase/glucosamine-1-phosphate N-acetyltransferase
MSNGASEITMKWNKRRSLCKRTDVSLSVIILAAGAGKRMHSALPKVLHRLAGKPLLAHVVDTVKHLNPAQIYVVYGYQGEQVKQTLADLPVQWVPQAEQLGTGHAVAQVLPYLADDEQVLVLFADVPLISLHSLQAILIATPLHGLGLLVAQVDNPTGLGRILRDDREQICAIIEERDANEQQRKITEIYGGILTTTGRRLKAWLPALNNNNAQGEYYLTDIVAKAIADYCPIHSVTVSSSYEILGVNDRQQLAVLERHYQSLQAAKLMANGVTLADPQRLDIRGELQTAADVYFDINVIIEGKVTIGANSKIGAHCILRNTQIGENVEILPNSIVDGAVIEAGSKVGPYARIRPKTYLAANSKVGNFVEVKNTAIGEGSKVNHLNYLGDAQIGKQVNIGAGTIICNYDGVAKHTTTIGDGAFIGSDCQLVAPVTIGPDATIGAGSTITHDAPAQALTLSRVKQRSVANWKRRARASAD